MKTSTKREIKDIIDMVVERFSIEDKVAAMDVAVDKLYFDYGYDAYRDGDMIIVGQEEFPVLEVGFDLISSFRR